MLQVRQMVLFLGDISILALSFCIMALIRFNVGSQGVLIWFQIQLFSILFILWLIVFFIFDLYNIRRVNPNPRNVGLLVAAMAVNMILAILTFYFVPESGISPKTNLVILGASSFILLACWRRVFYLLYTNHYTGSIAIIGTSPLITHLIAEISRHRQLGTITYHWQAIPESAPTDRIDILITEHVDPQNLLAFSRAINAEVLSLSDAYETLFGKIPLELMTEEKAIQYMSACKNPGVHFLYRLLEIAFAVCVLVIMLPFMIIAIIARLIEDGTPIFFNHTRVGKDGTLFTLYKLRSMNKDAERAGAQWATKKDKRITRVGRILRKTHIDEIPQMWNIIRGDMALVGPRPERPEFVSSLEATVPYYFLRHSIRPGFTGWAQIKYRYARSVDDSSEKFEYDLYYIKNQYPLLDIGIVLKTLQIIFTH